MNIDNIINRLYTRAQLNDQAARILTNALKNQIREKKVKQEHLMEHFKFLMRKLKNMGDNASLQEELSRNFDHLKEDLRKIYED
jgi:polyhydroxyalkanoate synthesis regulator phasin